MGEGVQPAFTNTKALADGVHCVRVLLRGEQGQAVFSSPLPPDMLRGAEGDTPAHMHVRLLHCTCQSMGQWLHSTMDNIC